MKKGPAKARNPIQYKLCMLKVYTDSVSLMPHTSNKLHY